MPGTVLGVGDTVVTKTIECHGADIQRRDFISQWPVPNPGGSFSVSDEPVSGGSVSDRRLSLLEGPEVSVLFSSHF